MSRVRNSFSDANMYLTKKTFVLCSVFWFLKKFSVSYATKNESSNPEEVCYPQIGCFSLLPPWSGIWRTAPQSPQNVRIEFNVITRKTLNMPIEKLKVNTTSAGIPVYKSLKNLDYRIKRPMTIVHIHGQYFDTKMKLNGLKKLSKAYLAKRDVNLIIVQWDSHIRRGYRQNVSNTRTVAAVASRFIKTLMKIASPMTIIFHLVGYSLGAHIAGYIGKTIPNIYRITALEAAQPGFENFSPKIRLHHSDAHFVDVLHTNAKPFASSLGLGYVKPIGDVDFYFNGGNLQPACFKQNRIELESWWWNLKKMLFQTVEEYLECSHFLVNEYWVEALQNDCTMWGFRVTNDSVALHRESLSIMKKRSFDVEQDCVSDGECLPVGWLTSVKNITGVFHVKTNSEKPYCINSNKQ